MLIDPLTGRYALSGRLVTMGPQGVLDDGAVYIERGEIKAVQAAAAPPPPGFRGAPRVRTGDTLYPGLIELHNHLSYNAMPLWDVPRKYANNGQWRGGEAYQRAITRPTQVLAASEGVVEALVRWVECRCLLGGVTTSQGITLSSESGIRKFYRGVVRNVEQPLLGGLPAAGTGIGNPRSGDQARYLQKLKRRRCYLQHLSEGTDETARGWFQRLRKNGSWALTDAFCGIHSTALEREDFDVLAAHGASMVWSPTSNYLLYGDTARLAQAKASGILISIGSDWAPSGSKNLLGELKVAWLASRAQGDVFTPRELVAMATVNAAKICRWDPLLGTIEPGKRADLLAINGREGDPWMQLIEARETSITLVAIDGVPRVGQPRLMRRFAGTSEPLRVGRSPRRINLRQQDADPLVADLGLGEASRRLAEAMLNLPELARKLETQSGMGLFSGSSSGGDGQRWQMLADFQEDDEALDLAQGIAAAPLSTLVDRPMQLEGITEADDPGYLRKLMAARNLPDFIKKGLPPLYGKTLALPPAAQFLKDAPDIPPRVASSTADLKTFLRTSGELTLEERILIVDQALVLLRENYVHLPLKQAMHAVDPVQRLRLLHYRLENEREGELEPEIDFHAEMSGIFNSLRDLHTAYRLPAPFNSRIAWLPFLVEEYREHGQRRYLLSKLVGNAGPDTLEPGVELTHWNGVPIQRAVAANAERQAGSNAAARHARGLNSLTLRPLARSLPPEEEWVRLTYRDRRGRVREWVQEWLVFEPGAAAGGISPGALQLEASALGLDDHTDDIQQVKKCLFAPRVARAEERSGGERLRRGLRADGDSVATHMPGVLRARTITRQGRDYGHIRIFTFNVGNADAFVNEFVRLVEQLPENGLILDLRGNGGGLIHAAEQLLQVLTPRVIQPERTQFINTPLNLSICRNHRHSTRFDGLHLEAWIESIESAVATGATYSHGYPITPPARCNTVGQRYYGPVVLVTDALCYSATDIFAAGFLDHGIGPILGVAENTGAGGANVWSHALLRELMVPDNEAETHSPYRPLPHAADLRVAVRRTVRVGPQARGRGGGSRHRGPAPGTHSPPDPARPDGGKRRPAVLRRQPAGRPAVPPDLSPRPAAARETTRGQG